MQHRRARAYHCVMRFLLIAMLEGFVKGKNRKSGAEGLWREMRRLADILTGVSLTMNVHQSDYG